MSTSHKSEGSSASGNNPWFALSMVLIGVIGGYAIAMGTGQGVKLPILGGTDTAPPAANAPVPVAQPTAENVIPVSNADHIRGNPNAKISVIEYSDYECPFCQRNHPVVQQVIDKYGDDVNWVFRHFPLSFHPNAMPAAVASECVADLGGNDAFWEFTDLVFEKQGEFDFPAYAAAVGVDAADFDECVKSGKFDQKIKDEMNGGMAAGVNGTPGNIIINNETKEAKIVAGAQPAENFNVAIDALMGN